MPAFFIRHPIIAIALSLLVVLGGSIAGLTLPIAQYPQITLPTVQVSTTYRGADAETTEQSVALPLEQAINGLDGMVYLSSTSSGAGQYSANVTSRLGIDPDMAAVQVQNRVAQASASLPSDVITVGVTTQKSTPDTLMYIVFNSPNGTFDSQFISSYVGRYVVDALKRVKGVGNVRDFGAVYAMRIWLKPDKLSQLRLTPTDVANAIGEQNRQAPAGAVGQAPVPSTQQFQYGVKIKGRLSTPAEFANIIIKSNPDGSAIRIKDVATVELGGQDYSVTASENGKPISVVAISTTPDASAVETSGLVRAELDKLATSFPSDFRHSVIIDNTVFVKASLEEVAHTLAEALVLVLLVVFIFLQSWRATSRSRLFFSFRQSKEREGIVQPNPSAASTSAPTWEAYIISFFGTHPRITHVPPTLLSSANMTEAPSSAAVRAARTPAEPPPMTNRSTSCFMRLARPPTYKLLT